MALDRSPFGAGVGMINEGLIAGCVREDRKAQYELYRALYPMMMSVCSRYERNEQDVLARVNTGFLKILQNIGTRKKGVPFEPWARRVIINTVIDEFRRDRMRKAHEVIGTPVETINDNSVNDYLNEMEAEAFAALLQELPPMSRKVFNLFAVDGFAHREIAAMLGISIGTSKWHVANARGVLQQSLVRNASQKEALR